MKKALVFAFALAMITTVAYQQDAQAWSHTGYFTRVIVLNHNFHKVRVNNGGCYLYFTVYFSAPGWKYSSPSYHMNYYRFQAKVTMSGGAWIRTPVFYNNAPGERTYTYTHNTGPQGCWAVRYHQVTYLQAVACRGRGCRVPYLR